MTASERTDALVDATGAAPRDPSERALAGLVAELRADPPRASDALRARVRALAERPEATRAPGSGWRGWLPSRPRVAWRRMGLVVAPLAVLALVVGVGINVLDGGRGPDAPVAVEAPVGADGSLGDPAETRVPDGAGGRAAPASEPALEASPVPPAGGLVDLDPARPQAVTAVTAVRVDDAAALSEAVIAAMRAAREAGGFTATLEQRARSGARARAELVVRVPVGRVETTLERFAGLGTLVSQRAEIVDLGERLDRDDAAAAALEARIAALRADVARNPDNDRLRAELRAARADLAAVVEGRARAREEARLATLSLTLTTPREAAEGVVAPPGRFERALRSGGDALGGVAAGGVEVLVVLSPLLALGLAWWGGGRPGAAPSGGCWPAPDTGSTLAPWRSHGASGSAPRTWPAWRPPPRAPT